MARKVGGVAAGAILGVLILILGAYVARYLFPLPPDTGLVATPDPNVMVTRASGALLASLLLVHAFAAAVAGVTAGRIVMEGAPPIWAAVGAFLAASVGYLLIVAHPLWFVMTAVLLTLLVGFGLGRLARN